MKRQKVSYYRDAGMSILARRTSASMIVGNFNVRCPWYFLLAQAALHLIVQCHMPNWFILSSDEITFQVNWIIGM